MIRIWLPFLLLSVVIYALAEIVPHDYRTEAFRSARKWLLITALVLAVLCVAGLVPLFF